MNCKIAVTLTFIYVMHYGIKIYLACYNFAAFVFWALYLGFFFVSNFQLNESNLFFLNIAQGMAILEIFHVAMKWVKSSLLSTGIQVLSRLLILVLINFFFRDYADQFAFSAGVLIVSVAWLGIELVRYSLYFLSGFSIQPSVLLWMRYSFFIILYPLGVTGEWFILITPVKANGMENYFYLIFLLICLGTYLYYFPMLYRYMWKQRGLKFT